MGNAARLDRIRKTLGPTPTKPWLMAVPDWALPDVGQGLTVVPTAAYDVLVLREGDVTVGVALAATSGLRAPRREEAEAFARELMAKVPKPPGSSPADPEPVGPVEHTLAARAAVARARGEVRAWRPCSRCGQPGEFVDGIDAHPSCTRSRR